MVEKSIIDTILKPMLNAPRSPGYLRKKEYKHLKEIGQKYFLTSAWYSQSQLFHQLKDYASRMLEDNSKIFACDLPYQCSMEAGLLMRETIENEMMEQSFNQISFMMEYEGKFYGSAEDALFNFETLNSRRVLKDALYPLEFYRETNNTIPRKQINEKRILSLDIALMASRKTKNDASCFVLNQCIEAKDNSYISNISCVDTKEGLVTEELGLLTMRNFYQYDCDFLSIDGNGVGAGVLDFIMTQDRFDPLYGCWYKAMSSLNNEDMNIRCKTKDTNKCLYIIKANAKQNNDMCLSLRSAFQNGYINLLTSETVMDEVWSKQIKGYNKLSANLKAAISIPYIQTSFMIDELINLEHDISNGLIKVKEKSGMRKDRYSSLEYNYYVVDQLRLKKKKQTNTNNLVNLLPIKQGYRSR